MAILCATGCCFCDGRAAEFVDEWVESGVCDQLFKHTGTRIFTGNQNGIVRWMERYEPESLNKAKYILHLKDYLFYKLTGKITTDATDQSSFCLIRLPVSIPMRLLPSAVWNSTAISTRRCSPPGRTLSPSSRIWQKSWGSIPTYW